MLVSNLYPFIEALVMAGCLAILVFAPAVVARGRGVWTAMAWTAAGGAWFLFVWELARAGVFQGTRPAAPGAALAIVLVPVGGRFGGAGLARRVGPGASGGPR
jgi:hypothetical protein